MHQQLCIIHIMRCVTIYWEFKSNTKYSESYWKYFDTRLKVLGIVSNRFCKYFPPLPAYPNMEKLAQCFIVLPITFHCGFWFPSLDIGFLWCIHCLVISLQKCCEFLPNLVSVTKNPIPLCKLIYRSIKTVEIFSKYGKH